MAIDNKYGKVNFEKPNSIGEDEPIVIFRAQDKLLPKLLMHYYDLCERAESPKKHLNLIMSAGARVLHWQSKNTTKVPESASHDSQ